MKSSRVLVIGTGNPGKLREITNILGDLPWIVSSLQEYPKITSPAEIGATYAGNARLKASYYSSILSQWVLADDSGLEVDALNGAPGLLSARYAGDGASDSDRRQLLLSELHAASAKVHSARFVCAVAIARPNGEIATTAEGRCLGTIIQHEQGLGGFGYDPLFRPEGYEQTFAELPEQVKNVISHRARALSTAREFLLQC